MIVLDIVLIVVLLIALLVGAQRGLVASGGTLVGLVAGGIAAYWLAPIVNDAWPWQQWRPLVVVALVLLLLGLGGAVGGAIGAAVRRGVDRTPLRAFDRVLGAVASVVVAALAISVVGSAVSATGAPILAPAIASSQVLRTIDRLTPPPVAEALAQLRSVVLDDALPTFGDLLVGVTPPTEPPVDLADPELALAAASVVRVSGTAYACGTSSTGTGFVVAPDRVVTNAHVVAGVDTPVVEIPGRSAREGRIVAFDAAKDLAVVAVDDLGVAPLPLGPTLAPGAAAVVQGYPYGGPFTQVNADVLSVGTVDIPDIYSRGGAPREIYALEAAVRPGNSGGPLLTADGVVAGVVFARGEGDDRRGYAMTMAELQPVAAAAPTLADRVSSGSCTS
ncbi:MarP family serine protease [Microbacterium sp. BK668]|uniref:MarP family serine protease n=1 Tax=Microbacterium sp. BK668 TaxID=2512118 RepID=UPI00105C972D|nr:MarP family serine protease [Microbacterium sp. BK668]TDN92468.1 colicin V production protein [Microbacterium sp. BK668]